MMQPRLDLTPSCSVFTPCGRGVSYVGSLLAVTGVSLKRNVRRLLYAGHTPVWTQVLVFALK